MSGTTTFSPGGSVAKDRPTKWNENAVDGRDDVDEMVAARLARGRATRMNVSMVGYIMGRRPCKIFTYDMGIYFTRLLHS